MTREDLERPARAGPRVETEESSTASPPRS